jgi:hypothetical protein
MRNEETHVIANSASSPPAPGTPAASTPGSTMVASASRDCEGGSMWTPAFWPICFNSWRANWNCSRRFNKLAIVSCDGKEGRAIH